MLSRISSHILGSPPHPSLAPLLPLGVAEDNREPLEDTHSSPGMLSLEGKVALVAGGNSGIGLAFADAMARAGAEICASDFQPAVGGGGEAAVGLLTGLADGLVICAVLYRYLGHKRYKERAGAGNAHGASRGRGGDNADRRCRRRGSGRLRI